MTSITIPAGATITVTDSEVDAGGPPLLTVFTPPDRCKASLVYDAQTAGTVWKNTLYNHAYGSDCLPAGGQQTQFRPGICPESQDFAQLDVTVQINSGSTVPIYYGYCCTSGYKMSYREHFNAYEACFSGLIPPIVATVRDDTGHTGDYTSSMTTLWTAAVIIEDPLLIIWNEDDLTQFSEPTAESFRAVMGLPPLTTTTASSTPASPSGISTSPALPTSPNSAQDSPTPARLSAGAIAGICIGVVAFLILQLTLGCLACARRRKRKPDRNHLAPENASKRSSRLSSWLRPPWKQARGVSQEYQGVGAWEAELEDTQTRGPVHMLDGVERRGELQGSTVVAGGNENEPVELPAEVERREPRGSRESGGGGAGGR
ncbi:hypothetical protein F5B20DRAFT_579832 [Whalleya microplaca]|nr:hypothetical protein F5B20DRAFT_579832 [Whalleya microplaca]